MPVQFNEIPGNLRVPLFYAEINGAQTPFQSQSRLLLIGQKKAAGTAATNQPIQVSQPQSEDGLFGAGSMLAQMYKIARRNFPFGEIWCLPLIDQVAGVAATGTITVASAPPSVGELTVYIAGRRVRIPVTTTDTTASVATALAAAINALTDLPVTAAVTTNVVTLTSVHKGTLGNFLRVETDYYGNEGPLGAILTIAPMAAGTSDPSLATPLANLGSDEFDFIAAPYADTTNLALVTSFLNATSGRWSPTQQLYGHYFTAKADTQANLSTYGNGLNDPASSVMGYFAAPSPPWEWAAAFAAKACQHLQDAPELSRPLHTLVLEGILPPKLISDRFSIQQRQALYFDGISSYFVTRAAEVCIDRAITLYQTNVFGSPDTSWLNVEQRFQSMFAVRYFKAKITGTWGRASLREENPFGIQGVATPSAIRNTLIHAYQELSALNVVERDDVFEQSLIVEINAVNPDRIDVFLPADMVNQLRVFAVNLTTFLQFPDNVALIQGR